MSATQTIAVQEILVKHKFSKREAAELLDYVDKRKDKSPDRLWIAYGILSAVMIGGFTALLYIMFYLHNDLKTDIKADISENRKLLIQLIQKK